MADILIGKRPPEIGLVRLDLAASESHQFESSVTRYPVEDGSPMTDHIQNQPDVLSMEGFVTDSPLQTLVESGARNGQTAFEALEQIHRSREPVRVFTSLKEYEDMALTSLVVPKTRTTGEALRFTASFLKIRKVSSEFVQVENLAPDQTGPKKNTTDLASETKDAGKQNTAEPKKETQSWLRRLIFPQVLS